MERTPASSTRSLSTAQISALVVGGFLTPVAMGLSLALLPVGATLLIYSLAGGVFAFREPDPSWQWGLWLAGGLFLVSVITLITVSILSGSGVALLNSGGGFVRATLLFGLAPAVVGGCLGGLSGGMIAHERYRHAGIVIASVVMMAAILPLAG